MKRNGRYLVSKYLLDTHILLWSLLEPDRLSAEVAVVLEDRDNELWLSPITSWEVIVLAEKGRIKLDDKPVPWLRNVFQTLPFWQANMTHEVAMESRMIQLSHQDPADRFIAASAVVYGLTLITSDRNLLQSDSCKVLKN
jgi:PIN domain nuclease of toxin-antitoxin system